MRSRKNAAPEPVSEQSSPEQSVPEQSVPEQPVPEQPVPEQSVPEQPVPEQPVPEQPVPGQPAPEPVSEQSSPKQSGSQQPVPEQPVLQSVPEQVQAAPEQVQAVPKQSGDQVLLQRVGEQPVLQAGSDQVVLQRVGPQRVLQAVSEQPVLQSVLEQSGNQAVSDRPVLESVLEQASDEPLKEPPVSDGPGPDQPVPDRSWNGLRSPLRSGRSKRLIGDVVVDLGLADRDAVEAAVVLAKAERKPTGQILVDRGVLRHDQLARVVAERFGLDYVDLSVYELDMGAVNLLDVEAAKRYQAVPVGFMDDGTLLLAMADPTNVLTIDDVAMITGRRVRAVVASVEDMNLLLARLGRMEDSIQDIVEEDPEPENELLNEEADRDAPVIKLVHSIIAQAVGQGASDIHIDPEEGDTRVQFRVDGVLYPAATVRRRMALGMVSRIKIMADLDISEKRVPQDGRLALTIDKRRIDIRVVTLPLVHGEGAVLRILDKGVVVRNLESLGMQKEAEERFDHAIHRPHGAVLVTGPTGSGKSTTLYAALNVLNDGARSILTIEDPVESRIAGVKQMQIAPKAGVTFDTGLRSMLRADPDVIMVGEIRDRQTAHIAVEAALTGHLVLSTLHTRDAPSALGRLMDMGIEPFLVSSAIDCVVAQRLVRMLCSHCKRVAKLPETIIEKYELKDIETYESVGCTRCSGSGYRGRIGLYEVMGVSEEIRAQILAHASVDEIAATAVSQGMHRLHDDGMEKVRSGQTSIAEIERMTTSLL
jgi:type IV pilus assembly protein PilB